MNDNDFINNNPQNNKYYATRNLNTEIENPEININSAVGINIKDIESNHNNVPNTDTINNYFNEDLNQNNFESNNNVNNNIDNNYTNNTISNDIKNSYSSNNINSNIDNNYSSNSFIPQNINNNIQEINNNENYSNNNITTDNYMSTSSDTNDNYAPVDKQEIYKPTLKEKKKQTSFNIPTELKIMIFIVFILLMFILVIPYIYDFIKEIELRIMS